MSKSFFYLIRFVSEDMVIQYGTVYKDIDEKSLDENTYIIFFGHINVPQCMVAEIINRLLLYLIDAEIEFEGHKDHIKLSKVTIDIAGIVIRYAVKAFLKTTGKQGPILPYLVYHQNQEFLSESAWESAHWHISYTIYKSLIEKPEPEPRRCCLLL